MGNFYGGRPGRDFNIDTVIKVETPTEKNAQNLEDVLSDCPFGVLVLIQGEVNEKAYCTMPSDESNPINIHNTLWMKSAIENHITYKYIAAMGITSAIFAGGDAYTYNNYKNLSELNEG